MTLGLFFDFHFPLDLVTLLGNLLNFKNFDPKNPATPVDTSTREWYSQPRPSTDTTTEVITVTFKLPLSVSELSADFLRKSCRVEIWYKDRSNNWMQMRDRQRVPLALNVSSSAAQAWYKYRSTVYPIVAKAVQIRITRTADPDLASRPYSLGMRNILIKRNVYERNQGVQALEDEQDVLGNVITKYIKDWDASKAVDSDAITYWKCSPQPDPAAVVALYLDVRTPSGVAQAIDKLYLDPVHSGQQLNLYYSSDDTVADRKLSPISVYPDIDNNTDWRAGRGRWDISGVTGQNALYQVTANWGPQFQQAVWVGLEWLPDFDPLSGPSLTPVLLQVTPQVATAAWAPQIIYDPGAGTFELHFVHAPDTTITFIAPMSKVFVKNEPVRIVIGWAYNPKRIIIKVVNRAGEILATTTANASALPDLVTLDGSISFLRFRGTYTAMVIKLQDWVTEVAPFLSNPTTYVSPDPVLPDAQGNIPTSSLDNAIYAADWTQQSEGVGGVDHTEYNSKVWTPIWRNYVSEKGDIFFPAMIMAKYLKLEFTNLTEEPYPIYESGIQVSYKVFPISVQQVATTGPRLYTGSAVGGLFGVANLNGVKSINWFDPGSILGALSSILSPQYDPVSVSVGPGYINSTMPNLSDGPITKSHTAELSSNTIYRRTVLDPFVLAADQYYTTINSDGLQKLAPYTTIPWQEIAAANPGAIATAPALGAQAVRGTDWWLFPGQQLKIPASVMSKLTDTSTVTERRATFETRVRFTTTAVHRYEVRTLKRDAAIAYFAGVREVIPSVSSYIYGVDKDQFDFPFYTPAQWVFTNIATSPIGSVTYDGTPDGGLAYGSMYFNFQTYSNFAKVALDFRDSGLMRSDAMWASAESDTLSPYTHLIPSNLEGSAWLDNFVDWTDISIQWGAPRGVVAVNLDGDRRYQGRRVLHFSRAPGAGEAGLSLEQQTNYIPGALFRLGCVIYKPFANANIILLRLVRKLDGVVIYETPVDVTVGRWTDFTTDLIEVPVNPSLAAPVLTKGATNTSGGTFAAGTYYWKLTAINANGETLGSNEVSATLVLNGTQVLNWTAVPGATGYKLYRGTAAGAENKLTATLGTVTTYTATGGAGTTATVPSVNTTAATGMDFEAHLVLTGDSEDDLYVSDLYSELTHVRYFAQLGGVTGFLHEVTDLRFKAGAAVVAPVAVQQCNVRVNILSDRGFCFGASMTPTYLK